MEFHEKLQYLRKQKELTQEQLAEKLYVSRTAVSKWESGKGYPNLDSLKCLSKEFQVSIDDLLSENDLPESRKNESEASADRTKEVLAAALDAVSVLLLFVPCFGQSCGDSIRAVTLFAAPDLSMFLRVICGMALTALTLSGIAEFFRPQDSRPVVLHAAVLLLFMMARQPYVSAFLFFTFLLKCFLFFRKYPVK